MSSRYDLRQFQALELPNAYGEKRRVVVYVNGFDRYTWRLFYPSAPDVAHTYTDNYFDSAKAARRSARRFMRSLAQ
jgi:hypothetical protein